MGLGCTIVWVQDAVRVMCQLVWRWMIFPAQHLQLCATNADQLLRHVSGEEDCGWCPHVWVIANAEQSVVLCLDGDG
jgi:hypothetical protein